MTGGRRPSQAEIALADGTGRFVARGDEPCRGRQDLYFPDWGTRGQVWAAEAQRRAIRLCGRCDRTVECYAAAEARHETHGVWGGVPFSRRRYDDET